MARTAKLGLSKHPTKGFRLTIGKKADGRPRLFWLGHSEFLAGLHARCLREHFQFEMKALGRDVWTSDEERAVTAKANELKAMLAGFPAYRASYTERIHAENRFMAQVMGDVQQGIPDPKPTEPPAGANTLHATMDRYVKWFDAKADRSPSSKTRLFEVMAVAKKVHPDIEVTQIDRLWLDGAIQYWKNRPPHMKTGNPISTYTVKTVLQHLSQFFNWMSDNEEATGFAEPKKMAKLFKYRPEEITDIEQLSIDEIKKLYAAGTDQQRLLLLSGITCGMTQIELAAATKDEFDFEQSIWKHRRHKTKVAGSHWLCPELTKLLKERIAETPKNPKNLVFLTHTGMELVTYRNGGKASDAVKQSWDDLLSNVDLGAGRHPTFKMCRKFLGQWVKDNYGDELAQVALQHKSQSVLSRHYAKHRNFDPLHDAQRVLYAELQKGKVFAGDDAPKTREDGVTQAA